MDLSKIPDFGSIVRTERTSKGLTLKQVADSMGYTLVYQSEIERGLKRPTPERIAALSKLLGLDQSAMTDMVYPQSVSKAEFDEAMRHGSVLAKSLKELVYDSSTPDEKTAISFFEKFGGEA